MAQPVAEKTEGDTERFSRSCAYKVQSLKGIQCHLCVCAHMRNVDEQTRWFGWLEPPTVAKKYTALPCAVHWL